MKYFFITALSVVLFSFCAFTQDTSSLKRAPYTLSVAVDKKTVYEQNIPETPYVLPGNAIQLYPGETVYIEVEQENGIIKNLKAVKEPAEPSKTITISFTQSAKKKVHELMMLHVSNPFSQHLTYKAKIFILNGNKWINTDVLPVQAGMSGYETWPNIITSIALYNWTLSIN